MARLSSIGFELNSTSAGVEYTGADTGSGGVSISSSTKRSGSYSFRAAPNAVGDGHIRLTTNPANGPYYARAYIYVAAAPTNNPARILGFIDQGLEGIVRVRLKTDMTLILTDYNVNQIGSPSSALSLDTWYRVELYWERVAGVNDKITLKLDGTEVASTTTGDVSGGADAFLWGNSEGDATLDIYYDDIAVNDTTGSFQNSWPGEGEIIHLRPSAAGDNADWTRGGTDSGANWSQVDEVTPNDTTDVNKKGTLDTIDDYNLDATPAALASDDTINCVQVGARFRVENASGADPDVVFRIKASSGGTVEESSAITASTTTWKTNGISFQLYPLTLYDLPGSSTTAWTKTDLDAAQIGARISTGDTHPVQLSTMWLLVDHKPAVQIPVTDKFFMFFQ